MATTKNASYKRYNGTDWDTIYFATTYSQVGTNDSNFFMTNGHTINGKSWTKSSKTVTLTGADINYTGETGTYITTATTLNAALAALDQAVLDAKNAIPSGVITTTNMGTAITKVGTITSGTWHGSAIADDYIASASTWNGKQDKLTFDTTPTANSTNPVESGGIKTYVDNAVNDAKSDAIAVAQGKTATYVIISTATGNTKFNVLKTSDTKSVAIPSGDWASFAMKTTDGVTVKLDDLRVGDIILTVDSNKKDWFYGGKDSDDSGARWAEFFQIDSDTPDLTGYALKSSLGAAASKGVVTTVDASANLPTANAVKTFVEGKKYITSYVNTTYAFAEGSTNGAFSVTPSGGSAQSVKVHGLAAAAYKSVDTSITATGTTSANLPTAGAVSTFVKARATKVFYADTVPTSGMIEGDICIEY